MSDHKQKILSSKIVLKSHLFAVREDKLQLPNGEIHTHQNVLRGPTVDVFPITPTYEVYLIQQYRYLLGKTILEAVAGFIDEKETALQAAKRELQEETGIIANQWEEFSRVFLGSSVVKAQGNLFIAKGLELGLSHPESTEEISLVKIPLQEAVEKIFSGEIVTSATITGILMLDKLRKEKKL